MGSIVNLVSNSVQAMVNNSLVTFTSSNFHPGGKSIVCKVSIQNHMRAFSEFLFLGAFKSFSYHNHPFKEQEHILSNS